MKHVFFDPLIGSLHAVKDSDDDADKHHINIYKGNLNSKLYHLINYKFLILMRYVDAADKNSHSATVHGENAAAVGLDTVRSFIYLYQFLSVAANW